CQQQAEAVAAAVASGTATATQVAELVQTLEQGIGSLRGPDAAADADEAQHFRETLAMFIGHATGTLADLEEEVLAVEGASDPTETIGAVRRGVHTLKAEFGVLGMRGPQDLCHLAESAIDAGQAAKQPFPVDTMLACVDALKQFVDRLASDERAVLTGVDELRTALQRLVDGASGTAESDVPVQLAVGGEYADSLPDFTTEARAHLADAEAAMLAFAHDRADRESINLTFRAFHTIKGVAGFLNLQPIVELAHAAETLLDAGREGRLELCQDDIDRILAAGDLIAQLIGALDGQPAPGQRQLASLQQGLQRAALRRGGAPAPAVAANGAAESAGSDEPTVVAASAVSAAAAVAIVAPPGSSVPPAETTREPAKAGLVLTPRPPKPAGEEPAAEPRAAKIERTVKVSTLRLDMMVDMVGELVIAQSMVLQDPAIQKLDSQNLARNIGQVAKITRDLQEAAMSLRMVTVKATFQKMARLVRDVAAKSGKQVALQIHGEDTELDRNVVEQISDPLVHMIRNAIDHGIEAAADRERAGKSPEGHLQLRAYHQGGSIVVEIQDDGRGIDKDRVVRKAVEKGLLPAGTDPGAMADAEAFQLIFLPGFSTADKVTDLSGRGVGMDVVRRNIEALRGKIEIDSRLGEGTAFRMRLPLTLAIIDGMVVRVGEERYVLPTLAIEQSFRPDPKDVHQLIDRGECVRVRAAVLPVHRLKVVFGQDSGFDDLAQGILMVVEADGERSCLFVDEILGQQQVVIKSLGMPGHRVPGVSGGAIMSDGRVALILDVGTLIAGASHGATTTA
ncbi:MAG: chemotaxis protein CheA, partial [Planctomycetes bacterium]|nr:chemotaxis protein CheA [Planctomycetota bacterium]